MPSCQTLQALSISWILLAQKRTKNSLRGDRFRHEKLKVSVKNGRHLIQSPAPETAVRLGSPWRQPKKKKKVFSFWKEEIKDGEWLGAKQNIFYFTSVLLFVDKKAGVKKRPAPPPPSWPPHTPTYPEIKYSRTAAPCDSFGRFSLCYKFKTPLLFFLK